MQRTTLNSFGETLLLIHPLAKHKQEALSDQSRLWFGFDLSLLKDVRFDSIIFVVNFFIFTTSEHMSRTRSKNMRTIEELSAGAIVYREDPKSRERRYLVLHYPAGHWDFPKGAVENGETEQEAAKREIFEETGILIDNFIPSFRKKIEYHYRRSDGLSHKQVIFFLAKTDREDVQISFEHSGYDWLDFDQSLRRLTFDNARNVLREAESFLSRQIEGSARSS